jgi:hypothetical protein
MKSRVLALSTAAVLAIGSLSGCFGGDDDCDALPAPSSVVADLAKPKPKPAKKSKKKKKTGGSHSDDCDDD